MSGFKNFVLRGNLVDLAVAFIMGTAFAAVVTATVTLLLELIGKVFDQPSFKEWTVAGGIHLGLWIDALVGFLILAAVVYFVIVVPYTRAKERFFPDEDEPGGPSELEILIEIRDSLAANR